MSIGKRKSPGHIKKRGKMDKERMRYNATAKALDIISEEVFEIIDIVNNGEAYRDSYNYIQGVLCATKEFLKQIDEE